MNSKTNFAKLMGGAACAAFLTLSAAAQAAPVVGAEAPGFTGTSSEGDSVSLSDFEGQMVVLEWTNKDCPFVQKHYNSGNMQSVQTGLAEQDVVWLQVISSAPGKQGHLAPDEANAHAAEVGAYVDAILIDESGEIGQLYDATATPHMYVIDADQTLRYMGAIDDKPSANPSSLNGAHNYVLAAVNSISAGEEVETTETAAYGCSVKY